MAEINREEAIPSTVVRAGDQASVAASRTLGVATVANAPEVLRELEGKCSRPSAPSAANRARSRSDRAAIGPFIAKIAFRRWVDQPRRIAATGTIEAVAVRAGHHRRTLRKEISLRDLPILCHSREAEKINVLMI